MQEVTEQLREMGKEVAPECDHPQQGGDSVAVDQDRRDIHMPQNVIQILQQLASLSTPEQKASIVPVRGAVLDVNGGPMYSPSSECLHEASMSPSQNPSSIVRHLTRLQEITAAAAALTHSEQPASISQADVMETPPPEVDPTTIVEWRQGLRHASKLGIQGPELKICMKKMKADQDFNVQNWWNEREKYKAALKTTDVMHPELQIYDRKIYKAQEVMEADFQCRLKTLGVPFFGVPANKIVKTDEEAVDGKITKKKLKELQEKMYQYLQDMYID